MVKQETLEETAEKLQKDKYGIFISKDADVKGQLVIDTAKAAFLSGMIEGAKWQQEISYIEANKIIEFLDNEAKLKISDTKTIERIKWYFETYFEQFKKK